MASVGLIVAALISEEKATRDLQLRADMSVTRPAILAEALISERSTVKDKTIAIDSTVIRVSHARGEVRGHLSLSAESHASCTAPQPPSITCHGRDSVSDADDHSSPRIGCFPMW